MPASSRSRAGFTLVELLVALVMFVIVAGSLYKVMNVSQRAARMSTEKAAMQSTLRTGLQIAISEMQEIWTDPTATVGLTSSLTNMTPTKVTYDALHGFGTTCVDPVVGATSISLRKSTYSGSSDPTALVSEKASIFLEKSPAFQTDDAWLDYDITGTPTTGTCTDGTPAWVLTLGSTLQNADVLNMPSPGPVPVRIHRLADLGLVTVNGRNWLGIGTGTTLTPLVGPLTSTGLLFKYYDGANAETTSLMAVKSIVLRLYGETDRQANQGLSNTVSLLTDSMTVRVQLRNGR
jgi:prepilin-type N-terminal cleavage/methylation domain-containing protein